MDAPATMESFWDLCSGRCAFRLKDGSSREGYILGREGGRLRFASGGPCADDREEWIDCDGIDLESLAYWDDQQRCYLDAPRAGMLSKWERLEEQLSAPVSERMLEHVQPGMRVLDLATGKGEPLLKIARRIGAGGRVMGIDPCQAALDVTRWRANQQGLDNLELHTDWAQVQDDSFDAATCRWGLFAVPDPVASLRQFARALKPGAFLAVALWSEYQHISWYSLPREVTARFIDLPDTPGPTRVGSLEAIEHAFQAGGLAIHRIDEMECTVVETDCRDEIVSWARVFLARWVDLLPPDRVRAWEEQLAEAAEALRSQGMIRLGGLTRIVVARTKRSLSGKAGTGVS